MSDTFELFQQGRDHLRRGMAAQATVSLEKAKAREPEKASIREALGIAYFRIHRYSEAESEFRKVLELAPVDDYAHYALGRASRSRAGLPRRTATTSSRAPSAPDGRHTRPGFEIWSDQAEDGRRTPPEMRRAFTVVPLLVVASLTAGCHSSGGKSGHPALGSRFRCHRAPRPALSQTSSHRPRGEPRASFRTALGPGAASSPRVAPPRASGSRASAQCARASEGAATPARPSSS